MHPVGGLSDDDLLARLKTAVSEPKLLPLPALLPPKSAGRSAGVRHRLRKKMRIWHKANSLALALHWLYQPSNPPHAFLLGSLLKI